jgi:hypothetical protein
MEQVCHHAMSGSETRAVEVDDLAHTRSSHSTLAFPALFKRAPDSAGWLPRASSTKCPAGTTSRVLPPQRASGPTLLRCVRELMTVGKTMDPS